MSSENLVDPRLEEEYHYTADPARHRRAGNQEKWPELKTFLVDTETKSVLGYDKKQMVRLIIFYSVFYLSVLTYFAILMGIVTAILDEIHPWQQGKMSPLKYNPGLAYRPVPNFQTNLIRFIQGKPSTYKPYTDHVQTFLDQYENEKQVGENFIDCQKGRPETPENVGKVCRFNIDTLGGMCTWQKDYGYDEGKPCIILKLNRIYGWRPDTYKPDEKDQLPPDLQERYNEDYIGITCKGMYSADFENIGNISYYPPEGFPRFFYPYLNQEGYRSPLVMIRFDNPLNGVIIHVQCKAWAKNMYYHENDQLGLVNFDVMLD